MRGCAAQGKATVAACGPRPLSGVPLGCVQPFPVLGSREPRRAIRGDVSAGGAHDPPVTRSCRICAAATTTLPPTSRAPQARPVSPYGHPAECMPRCCRAPVVAARGRHWRGPGNPAVGGTVPRQSNGRIPGPRSGALPNRRQINHLHPPRHALTIQAVHGGCRPAMSDGPSIDCPAREDPR
jgi:hypothetical protein